MIEEIIKDIPCCVVCSAPSGKYSINVGLYRIYKCGNCGLEYTWPIPSDDEIRDFYKGYYDVRAAHEIVSINAKRNLEKINSYFPEGNISILDFGCGDGDFVNIAGDKCFGIDIKANDEKNRIFKNINSISGKKFNAITLWGVMEHLTDPMKSMSEIKELLEDDGYIFITTVDSEGYIPFYYKPPEHLTYWTRNSIEIFFSKFDMEIILYDTYYMMQRSDIYIDRLLSRTPIVYKDAIARCYQFLPETVEIPTNEVFIIAKSRDRKLDTSENLKTWPG
jgi:2-polyprenyl-3-methyl-5-hydroxy-6-metoxy-1,4-benzoquinol methylase